MPYNKYKRFLSDGSLKKPRSTFYRQNNNKSVDKNTADNSTSLQNLIEQTVPIVANNLTLDIDEAAMVIFQNKICYLNKLWFLE